MFRFSKQVSSAHLGQAAELLVCFDFVSRGYDAVVNAFPGAKADITVDLGCGAPIRVQVKATARPKARIRKVRVFRKYTKTNSTGQKVQFSGERFSQEKRGKYVFAFEKAKYLGIDLFAFVAMDTKSVLYVPANAIPNGKQKRKEFGAKSFAERAAGSLEQYLTELEIFR